MKSFYEYSDIERFELTKKSINEKRTLIERWVALAEGEASAWSNRSFKAAELLTDVESVADIGCGTMILERYLRPDQVYIPIDVVARDDRTIVCDLNLEAIPETDAISAACLGIIEYIHEPLPLLIDIRNRYGILVISYCISDALEAPKERKEHAWVNDFSEKQMENLFTKSGWTLKERRQIDNMQKLWRLE